MGALEGGVTRANAYAVGSFEFKRRGDEVVIGMRDSSPDGKYHEVFQSVSAEEWAKIVEHVA